MGLLLLALLFLFGICLRFMPGLKIQKAVHLREEYEVVPQNPDKEIYASRLQAPEIDISTNAVEHIKKNVKEEMCDILQPKDGKEPNDYKEASDDNTTKEDFALKPVGAEPGLVAAPTESLVQCCCVHTESQLFLWKPHPIHRGVTSLLSRKSR